MRDDQIPTQGVCEISKTSGSGYSLVRRILRSSAGRDAGTIFFLYYLQPPVLSSNPRKLALDATGISFHLQSQNAELSILARPSVARPSPLKVGGLPISGGYCAADSNIKQEVEVSNKARPHPGGAPLGGGLSSFKTCEGSVPQLAL